MRPCANGEEIRQDIRRSDPPECTRWWRQMASRRSRRLDRGRTPLAVARRRPDLRSRRSGPEPERHTRRAAAHEEAPEISRDAARVMITDKLRSYGAARAKMGLFVEHRQQKGLNNRAENSHQPTRRRERIMKRFKSAPARAAVSSGSRSGRQPLPPSLSRLRPTEFRRASRASALAAWSAAVLKLTPTPRKLLADRAYDARKLRD
jgi:hypothetical protein